MQAKFQGESGLKPRSGIQKDTETACGWNKSRNKYVFSWHLRQGHISEQILVEEDTRVYVSKRNGRACLPAAPCPWNSQSEKVRRPYWIQRGLSSPERLKKKGWFRIRLFHDFFIFFIIFITLLLHHILLHHLLSLLELKVTGDFIYTLILWTML